MGVAKSHGPKPCHVASQIRAFHPLFGLGNYHIYFLVIPHVVLSALSPMEKPHEKMEAMGLYLSLSILFILELFLYRVCAHFWAYPQWVVDTPLLYDLLQYRLNYFPFFYLLCLYDGRRHCPSL